MALITSGCVPLGWELGAARGLEGPGPHPHRLTGAFEHHLGPGAHARVYFLTAFPCALTAFPCALTATRNFLARERCL